MQVAVVVTAMELAIGRTGVYELLEMTKAVVDAAHTDDNARFIEAANSRWQARLLGSMQIELVSAGITTVSEAMMD